MALLEYADDCELNGSTGVVFEKKDCSIQYVGNVCINRACTTKQEQLKDGSSIFWGW